MGRCLLPVVDDDRRSIVEVAEVKAAAALLLGDGRQTMKRFEKRGSPMNRDQFDRQSVWPAAMSCRNVGWDIKGDKPRDCLTADPGAAPRPSRLLKSGWDCRFALLK